MKWKVGKAKSTVVSDTKVKNTNFPVPPNREESSDEDLDYYGGYLVCESIGNEQHAKLIAEAPLLLEYLKAAIVLIILENNNVPPNWLELVRSIEGWDSNEMIERWLKAGDNRKNLSREEMLMRMINQRCKGHE